MREHNDEIEALGASIIAIGTGNQRYAAAFVTDEQIPFLVLVDDDAEAANAAAVKRVPFIAMFSPKTWKATRETSKRGFKIHKAGQRVTQMGGTWIIAPGNTLKFEHVDDDSTDHASIDAVLGALR